MDKGLIPVNIGEKLKYPLFKPILLFMNNGKIYGCQVIYAGKDFIVVIDLQERVIDNNNNVLYLDLKITEKTTFQRNRIDGYSKLEIEEPKPKIKYRSSKVKPLNEHIRKKNG